MGTVTLTDVTTGAPILASNLNNGWSALRTTINGGLDETNFSSGQLYSLSKLRQDGAATNDVMYWTGTTWDNTPLTTVGRGLVPVILARASGTVDVTNTTTETSLVSTTVTGGVMSTDRCLRLTVIGDVYGNVAVNQTFRFKFGGNTLWGDLFQFPSPGLSRFPWTAQFLLANVGSASVQMMAGYIGSIIDNVGSVAGFGTEAANGTAIWGVGGTGGGERFLSLGENSAAGLDVNTASDQALVFSVQHTSVTAVNSLRRHFWILELL